MITLVFCLQRATFTWSLRPRASRLCIQQDGVHLLTFSLPLKFLSGRNSLDFSHPVHGLTMAWWWPAPAMASNLWPSPSMFCSLLSVVVPLSDHWCPYVRTLLMPSSPHCCVLLLHGPHPLLSSLASLSWIMCSSGELSYLPTLWQLLCSPLYRRKAHSWADESH